MRDGDAVRVAMLVEIIKPTLAGELEEVQSAVLADLLAMWLAGHVGGSELERREVRERLLAQHIKLVFDLLPVNEAIALARMTTAGRA